MYSRVYIRVVQEDREAKSRRKERKKIKQAAGNPYRPVIQTWVVA